MTTRDEILSYLTSLKLKNFKLSSELPFLPNGTQLHLKNPKTIYVDTDQTATQPFMQMFNETIDQEITTIAIYLATDAKQLPQDYSTVVNQIRAAKEVVAGGYFIRNSDSTTEYDTDLLITTVIITLSKIIT